MFNVDDLDEESRSYNILRDKLFKDGITVEAQTETLSESRNLFRSWQGLKFHLADTSLNYEVGLETFFNGEPLLKVN